MHLFILIVILQLVVAQERLSEPERVAQWHARNTWPPQWQPEHASYTAVMEQREVELMQLTGADERWENWMQFTQGRMLPRFTELGFEVRQTPPHVHAKLRATIDAAVANFEDLPEEENVKDSIYGQLPPKFVHLSTNNQACYGHH